MWLLSAQMHFETLNHTWLNFFNALYFGFRQCFIVLMFSLFVYSTLLELWLFSKRFINTFVDDDLLYYI